MCPCQMTMNDAASAVNARLAGDASLQFNGVNTDSRNIKRGELFVALKGPNFDAHDYVGQVVESGAAAVMVERDVDVPVPQLIVPGTLQALGQLAQHWRLQFDIPLVGVTGSNGKTTVKEMLASIFRIQWETLATQGNLNNNIGLPLTLLKLGKQHQAAVIEMGANHPGEIAYLTGLTKPQVALITNAGAAHLEGFGSVAGVASAKGEIYQGLSDAGVAVINANDEYADLWRELAGKHAVLSFGIANNGTGRDGSGADVTADWTGDVHGSRLTVTTPVGQFECQLALAGRHNVLNALAATAAAVASGVAVDNIRQGLENMQPVAGRLQTRVGLNGARIIDDTYNANPFSLQAALDVLAQCEGKKFLALGDMGELGDDAVVLHARAGQQARDAGVDWLYTIGENARHSVEAFGERARHFDRYEDLVDELRKNLNDDVTLLVKGSRSMHMERVVNVLTGVK